MTVDPTEARDGDVQVFRSPLGTLPRWLLFSYAFSAVNPLLHVVFDPDPFWGILLALWAGLIGVVVVARRREKRHPAELVLTARDVVKRPGFGKERSTPWDDVEKLYVDPAGGPRIVNLLLRNGRYLRLLAVREEDVPAVKARWDSIRAARNVPGPR